MTSPSNPHYEAVPNAIDTYRGLVGNVLQAPVIDETQLEILGNELFRRRSEDLSTLSPVEQASMIVGKADTVLPESQLVEILGRSQETGKPLEIKYGIDPTGADVHWGHAVPMLVLDRMQRMGHNITFVIGGMTAKIGDPSGRSSARPVLSNEQIQQNLTTYAQQVQPLFDMQKVRVVNNNEWLRDYPLDRLIDIALKVSSAMLLQREDFRTRMEAKAGLSLAEIMYPVVMALDSQHLNPDIEVGGRDQFLNLQMCREVMRIAGQEPEVIVTTDILKGTDGTGAKMSKSIGNYIGLSDEPGQVFGKIMSIPDTLLGDYFKMLTELQADEWDQLAARMATDGINPMKIKMVLASDIVAAVHGPEEAQKAKAQFVTQFSARNYDKLSNVTQVIDPRGDVLSQLKALRNGASNSAIGRLLSQGGVQYIDEEGARHKLSSIEEISSLTSGHLKLGKTIVRLSTE